jgi:hypothetical protein
LRSQVNAVAMTVLGFSAILPVARAQEVDAYVGVGGAHDSSTGARTDTFGDGTLYRTPKLGGFFSTIGGSVFVTKQIGLGAELSWRLQSDYAGVQYRPSFYSFDGIFRPSRVSTKRFAPEFRLGLGGVRIHYFPDDPSSCDQLAGCPSSHHFQVQLGASAPWYLTNHVYLRPAIGVHYVNNFFEFGRNWVPQYSMGIGYSFGRE